MDGQIGVGELHNIVGINELGLEPQRGKIPAGFLGLKALNILGRIIEAFRVVLLKDRMYGVT